MWATWERNLFQEITQQLSSSAKQETEVDRICFSSQSDADKAGSKRYISFLHTLLNHNL